MKRLKLILILLLIVFSVGALISWKATSRSKAIITPIAFNGPITMCGTDVTDWADTSYVRVKLLSGLGNLHYAVSTKSEKAQAYFDQGLRLVYGFNHWEAVQSFREAIRQDPSCAMGYWGLALAYGPNLNDVNSTDREKLAYDAIQKAMARADGVTEVERDLIYALAKRYDGKAHAVRDTLNQAYADAMTALLSKYSNDPEVLTQTADAIMNTMPWDYWNIDGTAKPATAKAKEVLETTLKKFPSHAGAHHLYIHLVEASPVPDVALPSAKFLEDAMPGSGHLVHMPAHIYIRTGQYDKSIYQNERAVIADEEYLSQSENRGMYRWAYYPHNIDFIGYSAYMEGRSRLGTQTAMKLAYKGSLMSQSNPSFAQYLMSEPMHAFVRFGKWTDILSLTEPDDQFMYVKIINHFSKGLASLRTNQLKESEQRFQKLDSLCALDQLQSFYFAMNPASMIVQVPRHILKGELLISQGKTTEGIDVLKLAVQAEDKLRYNEPPDWKIPARQFLGAALLEAGKYEEAKEVFEEDLRRNRENGWALKGLQLTLEKLNKKQEGQAVTKRFQKAWKNADVDLKSSRF